MEGVEIIKLKLVKKDARGSTFQFDNRNSSKLLLAKRKKGSVSGRHFHTGKSRMKNPETMVIIDGKFQIVLKNVKTGEQFRKTCASPVMFKIDPYIYHEVRALTDILLIDMNAINDDKGDTVRGFPARN
ncbi:MAG: hypothetical protein Q8N16_02585 [bacterium]|nr:hypothetical protein [bacterium]